jgi:DNA adenine methylase
MAAHDGPETLHYADPPYVAGTRGAGRDYRFEMSDAQHRDLAEFLSTLQGMVIVSGYPSPLYAEIFAGWQRVEHRAFADGARERTECLWLRNVEPTPDLFSEPK